MTRAQTFEVQADPSPTGCPKRGKHPQTTIKATNTRQVDAVIVKRRKAGYRSGWEARIPSRLARPKHRRGRKPILGKA